jgi:hypothetical protein
MNPIILAAVTVENQRRVAAGQGTMNDVEADKFVASYVETVQKVASTAIETAVHKGVSSFLDSLFGLSQKAS